MNPHQKNKVDISSLTSDEQRLFRLYGKLPNKSDLLQNKLKERKYFDSGDYALSKAGKASDTGVTIIGSEHPQPGHIPHLSANSPPNASNPSPNSETFPSGTAQPGSTTHRGSSSSSTNGIAHTTSRSPVKEASSFLARTTSVDEEAVSDEYPKPIGHAAETGDLRRKPSGGAAGAIPIRH